MTAFFPFNQKPKAVNSKSSTDTLGATEYGRLQSNAHDAELDGTALNRIFDDSEVSVANPAARTTNYNKGVITASYTKAGSNTDGWDIELSYFDEASNTWKVLADATVLKPGGNHTTSTLVYPVAFSSLVRIEFNNKIGGSNASSQVYVDSEKEVNIRLDPAAQVNASRYALEEYDIS